MNKELLSSVIFTLNSIDVHGKTNLDRLLGCIRALETIQRDSQKESKEEETVKEESNG